MDIRIQDRNTRLKQETLFELDDRTIEEAGIECRGIDVDKRVWYLFNRWTSTTQEFKTQMEDFIDYLKVMLDVNAGLEGDKRRQAEKEKIPHLKSRSIRFCYTALDQTHEAVFLVYFHAYIGFNKGRLLVCLEGVK